MEGTIMNIFRTKVREMKTVYTKVTDLTSANYHPMLVSMGDLYI
jgi:transposase-like protein